MSVDHSNVSEPSVPNNSNGNNSEMREGEVEDEKSSVVSAAKSAFEITSVSTASSITTASSDDLETSVRQPTSADTNGGVDPLKRKASGESQDNIEDVKVEGATGNRACEVDTKPALGDLALHLHAQIQGIAEGNNPSVQQGTSRFKRLNNYTRGRWAVRDTSTPTDSPTPPNVPALDASEPDTTPLPPPSTIPSQFLPTAGASIPTPIAVSSAQDVQNYTYALSSKRSHMTTAGTNSAEYRTIQEKRSQLVTKITEQAGVNWFSENLQKHHFVTTEQALDISKSGVSAEDKVSSLLEAVESKIESDQWGTQFRNFVEMLESEGCLKDMGQTLQYECQMIKHVSEEMITGQIAKSGRDANPSFSTRYTSIDPKSSMTGGVPHSPKRFPVEDVEDSSDVYGSRGSLPEEDENNTNMVDGELPTLRSTAQQQVDVLAPSSMAQTSTLTRTKYHISADVAKKDSQISDLKEQLQQHMQQEDQLEQRVAEQEKQITALTEKNGKLETEVREKTEELTRTTNQLKECEQNLNLEKQSVQQLKQQIQLKTAELESTREQLANKEKAFEKMRRDKEKEIAELREALEEKAKEVEAHEERVTGLRAEQENLKLKLAEKQNELLEAKLALAQKGEMLANTKTELIQLQSEKKLEEERRNSDTKLEEQRRNSEKKLEEQHRNSEATLAIKDAKIAELREIVAKIQHSDKDSTS